jgi:type I restriction enzyme R subunit
MTSSGASTHSVQEEAVELAALSWFDIVGWRTIPGDYLAPGGPMGARDSYSDVILLPELKAALATLNSEATPDMIDRAIRRVLEIPSQDLKENNRAFHSILNQGFSVEAPHLGEGRYLPIRLFDREKPENNRLLAANQFVVQGEREVIRPDIVAFVNGIPLAVLELKSPISETATLETAYTQIGNYIRKCPELFRTNQVLVLSDGIDARIGSLTAGLDRFGPWRTIDGTTRDDDGRPELEVLIRGVFAPERFLDLVIDHVAFEIEDGVVKSKKIAGYHQFHAVRKALASAVEATADLGDRKGGVVWHTQGSGKSLTMLFFVRQLQLAKVLRNPTIVIVTDRNDLDQQLFGTFCTHSSVLRGRPQQANDVAELRELLKVDIGGIVFTSIQKFRGEDGSHPLLTDRSNVIVIADEAHRTQYGLGKRFVAEGKRVKEKIGFAEYLRQALPNATFVGFTGTPIDEKDRNTEAVFGEVIDTYDMTQSVADKATVPIHYTARLARLRLDLSDDERAEIDALAEELAEGDDAAVEREKGKLTRFEEAVGASDRIKLVAADIVQHFEQRREAMAGGKAMIVAISRKVAVELYDEIAKLRPEWASADPRDDNSGRMKVVITGNGNRDPEELQPHLRNKKRREDLAERFKKPDSGFDIAIVRDMWLTGFDAPSLHTLYIDKPMRGHGLMQAIARVNRVWGAKPGGLIVDYLGIGAELRSALAQYTDSDREQVKLDLDGAIRLVLARLESAEALLSPVSWSNFFASDPAGRLTVLKQCMEHLVSTAKRDEFVKVGFELESAYALCAGDERVKQKRDEIALMSAIRANLVKYTTGRARHRYDVEADIRQLISRAVMADGILDVFHAAGLEQPDLAILSEEFLAEVANTKEKGLAVETLRRLLAGEIKAREKSNLIEAKKLTERLEDTLRRYHNRAVDSVQVIEELIALAHEIKAATERGAELDMSSEEVAFYDALAENGSAKELMQHEQLRILAQVLVTTIRNSATIDWTRKESVRAKMRIEVRKTLARYGYPPDLQKAAVDLVIKQAEALAEAWD